MDKQPQVIVTDRPLECGHCKKPLKVVYKEIINGLITITEMCADCPLLQQKLYGHPLAQTESLGDGNKGLCCGKCGTTLDSIKMGNPLGCSECYEVFGDSIALDLLSANKLPSHLIKEMILKKVQSLHIGRSPDHLTLAIPSARLTALSEALNEALKRENYEQAAWLRDQIKALMERPHDGQQESP